VGNGPDGGDQISNDKIDHNKATNRVAKHLNFWPKRSNEEFEESEISSVVSKQDKRKSTQIDEGE
jgi:hypothetical protein